MRWVDLRLVSGDASKATSVIVGALGPVDFTLDTNPITSAPGMEVELSVAGHSQATLERLLRDEDIEVLAARERLGEPAAREPRGSV